MSAVICDGCGGTGVYHQNMGCVRCNGKGVVTEARIKHLMENYYPRKLATGEISRDVFAKRIEECRALLAKVGCETVDLSSDIERIARAKPLDAAMCARHSVGPETTMLEMKKKFPSIFVEEF